MEQKYSIGIGLNLFDAKAICLRDDGKVMVSVDKQRKGVGANETIEVLLELFKDILNKSKKYKKQIQGVGVALGGVVNNKKGVVYWPQQQETSCTYIALPLKAYLEENFGFPVILANDSNASAWAEYTTHFSRYKDLIYMFSGVGCGLILNGSLYKGNDGGAGELFLNNKAATDSHLGGFSFLSQWPIDLGMVSLAKEQISLGQNTSLVKKITSTGDLALSDIFKESKKNDKVSKEVIEKGASALGVKISYLVNLLNPKVVIIGGGLEEAGTLFLDTCSNVIKKVAFSEMKKNLKISFSKLGRDATSQGVALLVFQEKTLQ